MASTSPDPRSPALLVPVLGAILIAVIALAAGAPPAAAAHAADLAAAPPFSVPASDLLAAAAKAPPEDSGIEVLLTDARFTFDEAGRKTYRRHWIYRVVDAAGAERWNQVQAYWSPWHQDRPTLRARVVTADGMEHRLDPSTLSEVSPGAGQDDVYQDRRTLTGPLPSVAPGAVVEELEEVADRSPLFADGTSRIQPLSLGVPVRRSVVVVVAPDSLPLRYVTSGVADDAAVLERSGGEIRLRVEARDLPADTPPPPGLPPEVPRSAYVAFSTGASWSALARSYSAIVDRQIADADLGSFAPPVDESASQWEAMEKITATLHREVRYTGVELGEAALVPRSPAEVLARGYGDCKDKATLLVALLRRAGVPAYVALLRVGSRGDVEAKLPGMGSFDHAIVFVPGTPALWIDATDPYSPLGELPPDDQGRLALVASPNTRSLVRTPVADASVNHMEVSREVHLAERGPAPTVETDLFWGAEGRNLRSVWAVAADQVTAQVATKNQKLEVGNAGNLDQPFRMVIEVPEPDWAATTLADAAVGISRSGVLEQLPPELTDADGEARKQPYLLARPHAVVERFHIVPPPGFALTELPADEDRDLGPAHYTARFKLDGETIWATLTFTLDRRRLTPEEFNALREAAVALAGEKAILIHYDQVGFADLQAGRVAEALAEYRKLADLHPKEALHQVQLANALIAGGLGAEARAAARRATELEPGSALAFHTLGVILSSDPVGRRFASGFDRDGARAALEKAVALDPDDRDAHVQLALVLEHDADGKRYSPDADLDGAIEEYEKVQDRLAGTAFEDNLYFALFRARRFDELADQLADHADSSNRRQLLTAAEAMTVGPETAIQRAERRAAGNPVQRQQNLFQAGQQLFTLRIYPQAAALVRAAARSSSNAAELLKLAETLGRARRHEDLKPTADTPEGVVRAMIVWFGDDTTLPPDLLAPAVRKSYGEEDPGTGAGGDLAREAFRAGIESSSQEISADVALDLALALPWDRSGDDATGFRIRLAPPSPQSPSGLYAFAVKADGAYRFVALSPDVTDLGLEVLDLLDRGEPEAARRWLDWIAELVPSSGSNDDPLEEQPFHLLWSRGQQAPAERMRLAAEALRAERDPSDDSLKGLDAALRSGRLTADERTGVLLALARGYLNADRGKDALPLIKSLVASAPASDTGLVLEALALSRLGRWDDIVKLAQTRPESTPARRLEADALLQLGDLDGALAVYRDLEESGRAEQGDYNQLAWFALAEGQADERTLGWAQRAAELGGYKSYASMHTLASAYADLGRPADAYRVILQTIELRPGHVPDGPDWYVFGRLAELYGLPDAARRYYGKIDKPEDDDRSAVSTWAFAQRRLKALGAGAAKGERKGRSRHR